MYIYKKKRIEVYKKYMKKMSIKSRRMDEGMKTNLMQWKNLKINCLWAGKDSKSRDMQNESIQKQEIVGIEYLRKPKFG